MKGVRNCYSEVWYMLVVEYDQSINIWIFVSKISINIYIFMDAGWQISPGGNQEVAFNVYTHIWLCTSHVN